MADDSPILVIGGGVIGLASAWQLARRGRRVTLVERDTTGSGASRVAAGMLAPVAEAGFDDQVFTAFGRASLARYPSFLSELEADSGAHVPFEMKGALAVAIHRDDVEALRRTYDYRVGIGLPVEWLSGSEAREIEPALSPRVSAAMRITTDGQVDARALVGALATACVRRGVEIREHARVDEIVVEDDVATGVRARGEVMRGASVLLAAGAWSGTIAGVPADVAPPVRPVKGQIIRLAHTRECALAHVVRAPRAYLLPRADGTIVVGATQEEAGFDRTATAGGIREILEHAFEAVPSIHELPFEAVDVGLRPGSRDHLPLIGGTRVAGFFMATGHFRHGILLAPATADTIADGFTRTAFDPAVAAFEPGRFAKS